MTFESLKKPSEFSKVYKRGKSFADKNIVVYYMPNQLGITRVGFSISKKVGNSVVRNRVRRLIRESFRVNFEFVGTYDIIFVARVRSSEVEYHEMTKSLKYIFRKISISWYKKVYYYEDNFDINNQILSEIYLTIVGR